MKKLFAILATALFLCPPCAHARMLSIVGSLWPPYQTMEGSEVGGLGTDMIRTVLDRMGIESSFHLVPWERCIREYERGEADAVYLISENPERQKFLIYPQTPILTCTYVFFIRKKDEGRLAFDSYRDLAGHTVGVTSGYSYSPEFWEGAKQSAGVQSTSTDEQNFLKLANGRFDYFPCDVYVGADLIKKLGIADQVTFLERPVLTKDYVLAFSRNAKIDGLDGLVAAFDTALREFVNSEEYGRLLKKYLP